MMLTFLQRQLDGRLGGERVVSPGLTLASQLRLTTALGASTGTTCWKRRPTSARFSAVYV